MAEYKPEMQLRTDLQLKQQLKLIQTPIMIQRMELLQAPLLEVVKKLKKELEENPVLVLTNPAEIEETGFSGDFSEVLDMTEIDALSLAKKGSDQEQQEFKNLDEYEKESTYVDFLRAEEFAPRKSTGYGEDKKLEAMKNTASAGPTLQDFLFEQLMLHNLTENQIQIGELIIYNIDNNGYLRYHLLEIVNNLPNDLELSEAAFLVADERIRKIKEESTQNDKLPITEDLISSEILQTFEAQESETEEDAEYGEQPKKRKNRKNVEPENFWTNRLIPLNEVHPPDELRFSVDRYLWAAYFEAEKILNIIQTFEPSGVGTYWIKECLLRQLTSDLPEYILALNILEEHFELFLHQDLQGITEAMKVSDIKVQEAVNSIAMLNPRPGNLFAGRDVPYILPDIAVREVEGEYYAIMEDKYLPGINISPAYLKVISKKTNNSTGVDDNKQSEDEKIRDADDEELEKLLSDSSTPEVKNFIRQKVQSAKTLLDALEQRQITLERVAQFVIERQNEFFKKGSEGLKPLKMQDVADGLGLHVSTISRAVSDKYIDTPQGIFSLRYFFRSGTVNSVGEEQSIEHIKTTLKELIESENPEKPLSDDHLCKVLSDKMRIKIARRTVAKYRTMLNIPSSHKRKK